MPADGATERRGGGAGAWRSSLTLPAHAKVNLGLAVIARRGDGYHEVETVMARIGLADELTLEVVEAARGAERVDLVTELGPDLPAGTALGAKGDNLAVRAAEAYLAARRAADANAAPVEARIRLLKRIPVAAGLGGGSADAGAVVRGLAELLPAGVDVPRVGRGLGSDVPFMVGDRRAALAKGRGERLTDVSVPRLHLVLVNPGFAVSAAEAYAGLVGFTPRLRYERAFARLGSGEEPGWPNALQPGVLRLRPELRGVLAALREAGLLGALMSGSGPTCFGVARSAGHAAAVATRLAAEQPSWWVRADATL